MKDILELESRRKIFKLIEKNPGLHLSKIAELLHMRLSHVEYHIYFLQQNQLVTIQKEKGYTRYFIQGHLGVEDKMLLGVLRQESPLRIILFLLNREKAQHKEILSQIHVAPSTLTYHLKKMVQRNILVQVSYGEEKGFSLTDKEKIINLLIRYKPYNTLESYNDIWFDLTV